eukprot:2431858-Prymnesium_polylepis.1
MHMPVQATHAVRRLSWPLFSARCRATTSGQHPRDTGHETAALAASYMHLSCPATRQTIPDPTDRPTPTRRASAGAQARSSLQLRIARRRARGCRPGRRRHRRGGAAQLRRRASSEVAGDVLDDAHWPAAGHRPLQRHVYSW